MINKLKKLSPVTETTYYILLSLTSKRHGYGIILAVEELTNKRLRLAAGTLYGVLQNLQRNKLIELVSEDKKNKGKKEYIITDSGRELLKYEYKRLSEMVAHYEVMS